MPGDLRNASQRRFQAHCGARPECHLSAGPGIGDARKPRGPPPAPAGARQGATRRRPPRRRTRDRRTPQPLHLDRERRAVSPAAGARRSILLSTPPARPPAAGNSTWHPHSPRSPSRFSKRPLSTPTAGRSRFASHRSTRRANSSLGRARSARTVARPRPAWSPESEAVHGIARSDPAHAPSAEDVARFAFNPQTTAEFLAESPGGSDWRKPIRNQQ